MNIKQPAAAAKNNRDVMSKNLSILVEINQSVSRNLILEDSLKATLQILQNSYRIKSGAVFLVNDHEEILTMATSVGYRTDVAKTKYLFGEGLTGRIAETGKPIIIPHHLALF